MTSTSLLPRQAVAPIQLSLTLGKHWNELELLGLPQELTWVLRGAIAALSADADIAPMIATEHKIALAKKHIANGIRIDNKEYDLRVYRPDDSRREPYFALVRKWPGGTLRYLCEA